MAKRKNKYSTCVVLKGKKIIGYLAARDEENGLDTLLDSLGYTIIAL